MGRRSQQHHARQTIRYRTVGDSNLEVAQHQASKDDGGETLFWQLGTLSRCSCGSPGLVPLRPRTRASRSCGCVVSGALTCEAAGRIPSFKCFACPCFVTVAPGNMSKPSPPLFPSIRYLHLNLLAQPEARSSWKLSRPGRQPHSRRDPLSFELSVKRM